MNCCPSRAPPPYCDPPATYPRPTPHRESRKPCRNYKLTTNSFRHKLRMDRVVWLFEDWRFGRSWWRKVPLDLGELLERNFQNSITVFFLDRTENYVNNDQSQFAVVQYQYNLDASPWYQLNLSRGTKRTIRREVHAFSGSSYITLLHPSARICPSRPVPLGCVCRDFTCFRGSQDLKP